MSAQRVLSGLLLMVVFSGLFGCGDDYTPPARCALDGDCEFGQACVLERGECAVIRCNPAQPECQGQQRCIELPSGDAVCTLAECERDAQCSDAQVCDGGQCRRRVCATKADCPDTRICGADSSCVAPPSVCDGDEDCPGAQRCGPSGMCGASCTGDAQCLFGQVCLLAQSICGEVPCTGDDGGYNCLDGQVCVPRPGGEPVCSRPECATSAECPPSAFCFQEQCVVARCTTRDDCPAGARCAGGLCADPLDDCTQDADCARGDVCFPDGKCDPGCLSDADCSDDKYCDTGARLCATGCRDSLSCDPGLICGANRRCACNETSCLGELVCDLGACVPPGASSCEEVTCQPGFFCNPDDRFRCEFGCTDEVGRFNSCPVSTQCNLATGQCITPQCLGRDGSECVNTPRPRWNVAGCFCAECLTDAQCPAGEACNANGTCQPCARCNAGMPGVCGVGANVSSPYCVAGCCAECVSGADCAVGEQCNDGVCGPGVSCAQNPAICPQGTTCQSNVCQPAGGDMCDPATPNSCPLGSFCDQSTRTCVSGGGVCGACNSDCTCPNGLICNGFSCTGCIDFMMGQCPNNGICFAGMCL
jgi:hypothetical protein